MRTTLDLDSPSARNPRGYEFDPAENALVRSLWRWMRNCGVACLAGLASVLYIHWALWNAGHVRDWAHIPLGYLSLSLLGGSLLLLIVAWRMRRVVTTEGDDIQHLLRGLLNMTRMFRLVTAAIATPLLLGAGITLALMLLPLFM